MLLNNKKHQANELSILVLRYGFSFCTQNKSIFYPVNDTNIFDFDSVSLFIEQEKIVSEIIDIVFRFCGQKTTVIFCDKLKDLGFKHAFKAGISFGKDDLVIPSNKGQLIEDTKKLIAEYWFS